MIRGSLLFGLPLECHALLRNLFFNAHFSYPSRLQFVLKRGGDNKNLKKEYALKSNKKTFLQSTKNEYCDSDSRKNNEERQRGLVFVYGE